MFLYYKFRITNTAIKYYSIHTNITKYNANGTQTNKSKPGGILWVLFKIYWIYSSYYENNWLYLGMKRIGSSLPHFCNRITLDMITSIRLLWWWSTPILPFNFVQDLVPAYQPLTTTKPTNHPHTAFKRVTCRLKRTEIHVKRVEWETVEW